MNSPFSFRVEVRRDHIVVGETAASIAACIEDTWFRNVLSGRLPNDGTVPSFEAIPLWAEAGAPAVAGLTIRCAGAPACAYGLDVFTHTARDLIRRLLVEKRIDTRDQIEWSASAVTQPPAAARFRTRARRQPFPLHPASILNAAADSVSIIIEPQVLDAIRRVAVRSGTVETAGLLVGQLLHDRQRRAAEIHVTDQVPIPAGDGGASSVHFAFGITSFHTARELVARAGEGLHVLGWHHSHPPCAQCPRSPDCKAETVFFSPDDERVMACAFPAAYMVALVEGKLAARPAWDPGFRLYGWTHATIAERPMVISAAGGHSTAISGPGPAA